MYKNVIVKKNGKNVCKLRENINTVIMSEPEMLIVMLGFGMGWPGKEKQPFGEHGG